MFKSAKTLVIGTSILGPVSRCQNYHSNPILLLNFFGMHKIIFATLTVAPSQSCVFLTPRNSGHRLDGLCLTAK
jgi:hypothetical protein